MRKLVVALFVTGGTLASMAPAALAQAEPPRGPCNAGTMHAHATVPHVTAGNMVAHSSIPHCD
jgi:hypothetical protein